MKNTGIYRLLNTVTQKSYVGSSLNIQARKYHHFYLLKAGKSHSPKLQNAYNKYGADSFTFETLELCEVSELENCEVKWVVNLDSVQSGYNCSADVKCPTSGYKHSAETRQNMSEAQKKRKRTNEENQRSADQIRKYNLSLKGVPKSEAHRQKISDSHTGKKLSESHIQKMRGRKCSNEQLAKMRERRPSEDSRKKMSKAHQGKRGENNRSRPVMQIGSDGEIIQIFSGAADASRITGVGRTSIKNCLRGYAKTGKGFRWEYVRSEKIPS